MIYILYMCALRKQRKYLENKSFGPTIYKKSGASGWDFPWSCAWLGIQFQSLCTVLWLVHFIPTYYRILRVQFCQWTLIMFLYLLFSRPNSAQRLITSIFYGVIHVADFASLEVVTGGATRQKQSQSHGTRMLVFHKRHTYRVLKRINNIYHKTISSWKAIV